MTLSLIKSGTLFSVINLARPSAIAVFPTPDSPTSRGLFLLLLAKIWTTLSTSEDRPMSGSILPSRASLFKLVVNCSSALLDSGSFDSLISSPSGLIFSLLP